MDYYAAKKKIDVYGLPADFSTLAPDSIRYPPGVSIPKGLVNTPKLKEKISSDIYCSSLFCTLLYLISI